jgi:hypothetical protein
MYNEYEKANNNRRVTMIPSLRTDLVSKNNNQHKT